MVGMGIRVVRPEAPWHGRRVPDGLYGGEKFIATAPQGAPDLFTSAALEWSVLIDWFRRTTDAPIARLYPLPAGADATAMLAPTA